MGDHGPVLSCWGPTEHAGTWAVPRLTGAAVCVLLGLIGPALPALWSVALLAVVQWAVVVGDTASVRRRPLAPSR